MTENREFLTSQIITYIGNKRALLENIDSVIESIKARTGKDKCVCADLFSGSGIVARCLKKHSSVLFVNDLENYSSVLNSCYLTNKSDFDLKKYDAYRDEILRRFESEKFCGIITENYAPLNDDDIQADERAFYTHDNALRIDSFRKLIDDVVLDVDYKKFFLAPLLAEASVHVNTSGVFKGFYKNKKTGRGCFGGEGKNALSRILGKVELNKPVLSNFECQVKIFQKDTVELCSDGEIGGIDIAYLDPPYNQHPYGSNYFMLNLILKNRIDSDMSRVSGILKNWNRSAFNKKKYALGSLESIVKNIDAKFVVVSYNSEGFISYDEMCSMLEKYGKIESVAINYNTFRGSRNLKNRNIHVSEYLFILEKNF